MESIGKARTFLFLEAAAFLLAAQIHFGNLIGGYAHAKAGTAESVIATVLAAGLILGALRPAWVLTAAFAAQAFALLGTCVGLFTIAIGVGPRTIPDLAYHAVMISVLVWGLMVMRRSRLRPSA